MCVGVSKYASIANLLKGELGTVGIVLYNMSELDYI